MRDTFPRAAAEVLPLVPATRAPYRRPRQPLPDARTVRSVAVPDAAPPFDDAIPAASCTGQPGRGAVVAPAADRTPAAAAGLAGGRSPAADHSPVAGPGLAADHGPAAAGHAPLTAAGWAAGRGPGLPVAPPAGSPWPSQFAQALAETLAGARPAQQLKPWTSEQARRRISQLGTVLAADLRPRVRRVVLCSPAHDVLEMAVVVGFGQRTRAVAVRLEQAGPEPGSAEIAAGRPPQARWRCTAVDVA
jgi:hypothetical protein